MRTSVHPNPPNNGDPDDTDDFPGCVGGCDDDGELIVVNADPEAGRLGAVETTYSPGDWSAYTVTAD